MDISGQDKSNPKRRNADRSTPTDTTANVKNYRNWAKAFGFIGGALLLVLGIVLNYQNHHTVSNLVNSGSINSSSDGSGSSSSNSSNNSTDAAGTDSGATGTSAKTTTESPWHLKVPKAEIMPDGSGSFLILDLYVTNKDSSGHRLTGTVFAKTSVGGIYGPVDAAEAGMVGLDGFCTDNYINGFWNPGEIANWNYCLYVPPGETVTSVFIADSEESDPVASIDVSYYFDGSANE